MATIEVSAGEIPEGARILRRPSLNPIPSTPDKRAKINVRRAGKYPRVEWGVLRYPMAAVVGGGPSTSRQLDTLRWWDGDIFAINDTAKYLSDNGISCYLYAIDGTEVPFRVGDGVRGAIFATRVHRNQFRQMEKMGLPILVFDLAEEDKFKGIEGGPTAVCRTPHLLLRMGYRGVTYFGIDGSFEGDTTHVSGHSDSAHDNMLIIRAGGVDYVTHGGFMLQHDYMARIMKKHSKYLFNASGGVFGAMLENPNDWEVIAVAEDLKQKFDKGGDHTWNKRYEGGYTWQQPEASSIQAPSRSDYKA